MNSLQLFSSSLLLLALTTRAVLGVDDGMPSLDLASLFSGMQGGEMCEYRCPGGAKPVPRPGHKPKSNGCGTGGLGIDVSEFPDFTKCCDKHDFCYDTCGRSRAKCDTDFKTCLEKVCHRYDKEGRFTRSSQRSNCDQTAGLMYGGTAGFGCGAYQESQKKACLCKGSGHRVDLWALLAMEHCELRQRLLMVVRHSAPHARTHCCAPWIRTPAMVVLVWIGNPRLGVACNSTEFNILNIFIFFLIEPSSYNYYSVLSLRSEQAYVYQKKIVEHRNAAVVKESWRKTYSFCVWWI